ncbi:MAG: hypothetical protein ACYC1U_11160 [Candidatus Aquicultorales bacterium]
MRKGTYIANTQNEVKLMKKAFLVLLTVVFFAGFAALALAVDPAAGTQDPGTFTESAPEAGKNIPTANSDNQPGLYGASAWVYTDEADAGTVKTEGSYRAFQNQTDTTTTVQGGVGAGYYDFAAGNDKGPHDGYDTGSNKCKTCHAVHRANGSYRLMRVDSPDDACSYCHIGDHKHSLRGAYYRSDTVYPSNGHTMGAGTTIPDSSVKQWLTAKTMDAVDSNGTTITFTYNVREYNSNRNKMFYWSAYRSSYHDTVMRRIGPSFLSCLSCHQPHNADELIWKPGTLTDGYKLLRAAPSGSAKSTARMVAGAANSAYVFVRVDNAAGDTTATLGPRSGSTTVYQGDVFKIGHDEGETFTVNETKVIYSAGTVVSVSALPVALVTGEEVGLGMASVIKVPEGTIVKATNATRTNGTGNGISAAGDGSELTQNSAVTWTAWKGSNFSAYDTTTEPGHNNARLSVWCADCHNLNIGHYETTSGSTATSFRTSDMHSDRTHTSSGARIECWNCHSNNMPVTDNDYIDYTGSAGTPEEGFATELGCNQCHYYHNGPAYYEEVRQTVPKSDFPHSGSATGMKLLTEDTANTAAGVEAADGDLDKFCRRCHDLIGDKM